MARRVDQFPEGVTPIRRNRNLFHPAVLEAVELELFDSAYPDDPDMRRALAQDILKAIDKAQRGVTDE